MCALDPERLRRELQTARYGRSLTCLTTTGSTNDDARAALHAGVPQGHVIVADAQRQGRGSRGRVWSSPAGQDLYLSIVDRPPLPLAVLPPLTLAVGLGVARAVETLLGPSSAVPVAVKWPNDVWIAGRKCAGVLIESCSGPRGIDGVVIGIGLNVNRRQFPPDLALSARATSLTLSDTAGRTFDRTATLCTLLACVEVEVDRFVQNGPAPTIEQLSTKLALRGQRVRIEGQCGVLRGVDATGALELETAYGVTQIVTGRLEPDEQPG